MLLTTNLPFAQWATVVPLAECGRRSDAGVLAFAKRKTGGDVIPRAIASSDQTCPTSNTAKPERFELLQVFPKDRDEGLGRGSMPVEVQRVK